MFEKQDGCSNFGDEIAYGRKLVRCFFRCWCRNLSFLYSFNQGFQMSESGVDLDFDLLSPDDFDTQNEAEIFYQLKSKVLDRPR